MSDGAKTIGYFIAAGLALLLAWEPWRPSRSEKIVHEQGERLFPEFTDAHAASNLEITQIDEATSSPKQLQITEVNNIWTVPSHGGYTADAKDRMANAATTIQKLEILDIASNDRGQYELYGVVAPDPEAVESGAPGVGERVTFKDGQGKVLADVIIGKAVKDAPQQHYVRKPGKDTVYIVDLSTDALSTKFEDWIERGVLKFSPGDLKRLDLSDYAIEDVRTPDGRLAKMRRDSGQMSIEREASGQPAWKLLSASTFDKNLDPVPAPLKEDEELNADKLTALATALGDLNIVDVARKPKGLSANLRVTDDFIKDTEAAQSLIERGFYLARGKDENSPPEIFSSQGEIVCQMKDGVEYVLRFGDQAGKIETKHEPKKDGEKAEGSKTDEGGEEKNGATTQTTRHLFVMARFNPDVIPKPELEPLPEASDGKKSDDANKTDASKANEKKPEAKKPEEKAADDKSAPAAGEDAAKTDEQKEFDAKRSVIEKENQHKTEIYEAKVKQGKERTDELNERFADWYYVISDDVFKKIHLSRADLVKKKEQPVGEGNNPADFNALEKGLKNPPANGAPAVKPATPPAGARPATPPAQPPKGNARPGAKTK